MTEQDKLDLELAKSLSNEAALAHEKGNFKAAVTAWADTVEICNRVLGFEHQNTLASMGNLANSLRDVGEVKQAQVLLEKVIEIQRRLHGLENPETLNSINNLANFFDQHPISYSQCQWARRVSLQHEMIASGNLRLFS